MKNITKLFFTILIAGVFFSCDKRVSVISYEGGNPPNLRASTTTVSLEPGQEANTAIVFNWTNPDYKFTTGLSSHDVNYTFEMDTAGANFNSSIKYATVISKETIKSFTVAELNGILGNVMILQLNPRRNYTLQVRIISSLGTNSTLKLISNVISFTTKPFAPPPKVEPPTAGTLWATGDAFGSGWANPLGSPYDVNQKFTKLSNTLYELVVNMPGGGGYKLIQTQGDWSTQYHMLAGGNSSGGNIEKKDSDPQFPGPSVAGTYKITVDFQLGKFTAVKQ